jgi:hypothetical protein
MLQRATQSRDSLKKVWRRICDVGSSVVIASEAKQSRAQQAPNGLLRFARNDEPIF